MSQSEVRIMWFNNGTNNCSCLWLIIILILIFCCCGNNWGGNHCGNFNCGCRDDDDRGGCC